MIDIIRNNKHYRQLISDERVDKNSLYKKINDINNDTKNQPGDFISELICAKHMLNISQVKKLVFGESPDIRLELPEHDVLGVEVKRFRRKKEDIRDSKNEANSDGFVQVGFRENGKESWIKTINDEICKKSYKVYKKTYSTPNTILFLKSDSDYQIEWGEIEDGIKDANKTLNRGIPFSAIIYETFWEHDYKLPIVFIQFNSFEKKLIQYLKDNSFFHLKLLDHKGKVIDL